MRGISYDTEINLDIEKHRNTQETEIVSNFWLPEVNFLIQICLLLFPMAMI